MNIAERFFTFVKKNDGYSTCWIWTGGRKGGRSGQEYGSFHVGSRTDGTRKNILAHRFSYEFHNGPIEHGKVVHHTCDNKTCVNPSHLKEVSNAYNVWSFSNFGQQEMPQCKP